MKVLWTLGLSDHNETRFAAMLMDGIFSEMARQAPAFLFF